MDSEVAPPGAVVVPQVVERIGAVDTDRQLDGIGFHDASASQGLRFKRTRRCDHPPTKGSGPGKTKRPGLRASGRTVSKSRWRVRSKRLSFPSRTSWLRTPNRSSQPSGHLGFSSRQVAGSVLAIGSLLMLGVI